MTDEGIIKILLADDQPIIRQRLKSLILTCIGSANISEAGDTPSTLAITREVKPHVIILDISMPGGGGFRAIKTIKQQQPTPVVIVLTNYPYPQYRQRCLENGADYFLDKSSDFERIPALLLEICNEGSDPPPSDHTIRGSPKGEFADEKGFRDKEREKKTKAQLNQEVKELRQQVAELQAAGTKHVRTTEEAERLHYLLVALSHAAQNVQRVHTPGEVYRAVGDEIARLGHHAIIFTLTPERAHLTVAYHTFNSKLLRKAEKLAHLSAEELHLPVEPGSLYNEVINNGDTLFFAFVAERMAQFIPGCSLSLAKRVTSLLGIEQAFYAPLATAGEPYGMLVITGIDLVQADAPAVTAFANQTAIALENARLYQEARSWAAELEQRVEERTAVRGENEEKYITERKRAEQELITSEVRYRRLFETTYDGILILNAETGMILEVNPFLINMLGFSHEQFLGRKIWELGVFKDIAANQANFAKLQQQEYIRYDDLPLETSDGR
ncbi:MAG: response regulator, partial [Anaerolineales bacterium]|nr:response regulator [Anaerolineales bacterium]